MVFYGKDRMETKLVDFCCKHKNCQQYQKNYTLKQGKLVNTYNIMNIDILI